MERQLVRNALNVKNFRTFAQHVKGAMITSISVEKPTGGKSRLKYSAKDPRSRRVWNGEWALDAAAAEAGEKEFMAIAEKDFAVIRQDDATPE